jgi:sugar phosphate permease
VNSTKLKLIIYCWLVYGFYYLNRLNLSPVIPLIMTDLNFSHSQIGLIGALFYLSYTLVQLPAGFLADVLGATRIVVAGGVISAIANLTFGIGNSILHLASSQCLNGLGQGCGFTPIIKIIDRYFPIRQRARALGFVMTSTAFFNVAAFYVAALIGQKYGWRSVFICAGLLLIPMVVFFAGAMRLLGPEKQEDRLKSDCSHSASFGNFKIVTRFVMSKKMGLLSFGFFCLCYITYGNLVWLPSFLFETYHLSLSTAGLIAALYPLAGIISRPLGGYVSDVLFRGRRKQTVMAGWGVVLVSTTMLTGIDHFAANILLIITIGFFDNFIGPLFFAWVLDMVPQCHAGSGAGVLQFFGHIGTVLSIYVSGLVIDSFQSYRFFFLILAMVSLAGILSIWMIDESKEKCS